MSRRSHRQARGNHRQRGWSPRRPTSPGGLGRSGVGRPRPARGGGGWRGGPTSLRERRQAPRVPIGSPLLAERSTLPSSPARAELSPAGDRCDGEGLGRGGRSLATRVRLRARLQLPASRRRHDLRPPRADARPSFGGTYGAAVRRGRDPSGSTAASPGRRRWGHGARRRSLAVNDDRPRPDRAPHAWTVGPRGAVVKSGRTSQPVATIVTAPQASQYAPTTTHRAGSDRRE